MSSSSSGSRTRHSQAPRKVKPCFYYLNCGYCRYGRECKYYHPRSATPRNRSYTVYRNSNYYGNRSHRYNTEPVDCSEQNSEGHDFYGNRPYRYSRESLQQDHSEQNSGNEYEEHDFYRNRPHRYNKEQLQQDYSKQDSSNKCEQRSQASSSVQTNSDVVPELRLSPPIVTEPAQRSEPYEDGMSNVEDVCQGLESIAIHGEDEAIPRNEEATSLKIKVSEEGNSERIPKTREPRVTFQALRFRKVYDLLNLSDTDLKQVRSSEISYLQKRFPKYEVIEDDGKYVAEFVYNEDPFWLYDESLDIVRPNVLRVVLGVSYPKEVCQIELIYKKVRGSDKYGFIAKSLNRSIQDFLTERHKFYLSCGKVELVASAFLKWLDISYKDICIDELRKIRHEQEAQEKSVLEEAGQVDATTKHNAVDDASSGNEHSTQQYETHLDDSDPEDCSNEGPKKPSQSTNWIKNGTEIKLSYLELRESVATVECQRIAVTVQCKRCKTFCEVSAPVKHNWTKPCSKCHQKLTATFYSEILHSYSCILGYLHLLGCQAIDLAFVQCKFQVCCLNCNKKCSIDGINFGKPHITWCLFCNKKFSISAQAVKFQESTPADTNSKVSSIAVSYESSKKKSRDPAFKEGKPLPNNGACKHYKKSHRWLRFPCCGKAYACDLCHEENEDGHEMKFATRMICGFCSKEQPYGKEKSCDSCAATMAKKSGTHWEGGKGCRDRIKMSRNDSHKYSGVGKTTSRKVVGVQSPKKKKA